MKVDWKDVFYSGMAVDLFGRHHPPLLYRIGFLKLIDALLNYQIGVRLEESIDKLCKTKIEEIAMDWPFISHSCFRSLLKEVSTPNLVAVLKYIHSHQDSFNANRCVSELRRTGHNVRLLEVFSIFICLLIARKVSILTPAYDANNIAS
jgi:hypothetical protein